MDHANVMALFRSITKMVPKR